MLDLHTVHVVDPISGYKVSTPTDFFAFRAVETGRQVEIESVKFLEFGSFGPAASILVDESSGQIVAWAEGEKLEFVNTSIHHFTSCVREVGLRYPFYAIDSEHEDWLRAAEEIAEIVRGIDPPAYQEGLFWMYFGDEVAMGVFDGTA